MATKKFKSDVQLEGSVKLAKPGITNDKVLVTDGSGNLVESTITSTELGHLSGVTGSLSDVVRESDTSTALMSFVIDEDNMVSDSATKVPTQQSVKKYVDDEIAGALVSEMTYQGGYDASTVAPVATGKGDVFTVTVAGTGGGYFATALEIGDMIISEIASPASEADWTVVSKDLDAASIKTQYESNANTNAYTDAEQTKVGFITVTQAVDLDTMESDIATNNAKVTNATHTGEVTGSGALTVDKTAISNKTSVTAAATDEILIGDASDTGNLKKVTAQSIANLAPAGTDELIKISANDTTAGYLEAKIVASSGANTTNPVEITTLNDGADEDLQIQFDVAKVDHDSTLNFVANEHVDHSSVLLNTNADSGLTGGGDLTASRTLSVDINGTTAEATNDDADTILIYDDSAAALRKMTRANFLDGIAAGSAGDIAETSEALADNQPTAVNVPNLAFANATVRSFDAQVAIERGATFEVFRLTGIQKSASWDMAIESVGDDTGVVFSITAAGQVQYTSTNTGTAPTAKFRAETTTV